MFEYDLKFEWCDLILMIGAQCSSELAGILPPRRIWV